MAQPYATNWKILTQSLPTSATQLTAPTDGEIVSVLVASASAFKYSTEEAGTYRDAGLNPSTNMYEKNIPVAKALSKTWFKSASGTITVELEALLNTKA